VPELSADATEPPANVFICGFSRGAITVSYIGLADDEIAAFWKGMFTHFAESRVQGAAEQQPEWHRLAALAWLSPPAAPAPGQTAKPGIAEGRPVSGPCWPHDVRSN